MQDFDGRRSRVDEAMSPINSTHRSPADQAFYAVFVEHDATGEGIGHELTGAPQRRSIMRAAALAGRKSLAANATWHAGDSHVLER
jgi:hypothetical protein